MFIVPIGPIAMLQSLARSVASDVVCQASAVQTETFPKVKLKESSSRVNSQQVRSSPPESPQESPLGSPLESPLESLQEMVHSSQPEAR